MASITFTMVDIRNGVNNVSYDIDDKDMERIYDVFRYLYRPEQHPNDLEEPKPVSTKEIVSRLSMAFMEHILTNTKELETQIAVEKINIQQIQIQNIK